MSHDLFLSIENNKCDHCKRSDKIELGETNVSYNHCWIWYQDFDTEHGFRKLYHVPIIDLIPKLEKLKAKLIFLNGAIPTHAMNEDGTIAWSDKMIRTIECGEYEKEKFMKDDGWAKTNFNAYRCIIDILETSQKHAKEYPQATWYGD